MEKAKKYLQNVFLISILFHLIIFIFLNLQKINRANIVKEDLINKFPFTEFFNIPLAEIKPQQTENKMNPQIEPDIKIASTPEKTEQPEHMELIHAKETDLMQNKLIDELPGKNANEAKMNGIEEYISINELFPNLRKDIENKAWTGMENIINSGKGESGNNTGNENSLEFGRKKINKRLYNGDLNSLEPILAKLMEKSGKITVTTVRIWIDSSGRVFKAEISKSSGYIELDQLALDSIKKREFLPDRNEPVRIALIEIDFTNIR